MTSRWIGTLAALALAMPLGAQERTAAPVGLVGPENDYRISEPSTTLRITLDMVCERWVAGPYARYAQKYLGVLAPLSDRTTYRLEAAWIGEATPALAPSFPAEEVSTVSHAGTPTAFARVLPDRTSSALLTPDAMAYAASQTLFSLRRHRLELVTGEAGENVFGGGLPAALDELGRMEQEYLELFLGKQSVEHRTVSYEWTPTVDQHRWIVCRFTPTAGIVPASDLSGEPVLLELEVLGEPAVEGLILRGDKDSRPGMLYRLAAPTRCTLSQGNRLVAERTLPLFQTGRTVDVIVPGSKR